MSHTDGPWWATPPDEESIYWEVWDGYGHTATVYGDDAEAVANARLVASAPELLAACKEMAEIIHSLSETGAGLAVGAASPYLEIIRKAEGRE
jgi:hypothetical protein